MAKASHGLSAPPPGCNPVAAAEPLDCLVERARLGLTAVRTLWNAHASMPGAGPNGEDFAFGAPMTFVVDEIEALLDRIATTAKPSA